MRTLILAAALIVIVSSVATGQQMRFGGGAVEVGLNAVGAMPVGRLDDTYKYGIGGMGSLAYRVDPYVTLAVKSGYLRFLGDDITVNGITTEAPDLNIVPILGSVKYHFLPEGDVARPYVEAAGGAYLQNIENSGTTTTDFGVAPVLGSLFRVSDNLDVDIHANYTAIFADNVTNQWVGVGGGLAFHAR